MDRPIVYPGAIPLETDVLKAGKFVLVALARVLADVLGSTNTLASGFVTSPTAPASMQVSVAAGDILSLQNIDGTAYGDIAADVAHTILKQGIALDPTLITLAAPVANGQSIVYLIQVAYQDVDTDAVVLPYYNAASPSQPFTGPGGSGTSQPTTRHGAAIIQAKAGIAATTGSQTAPAPDAGYTGLYTVTVANGQTTITSANIAAVANAPFLAGLLNAHHGGGPGQAPKLNLATETQGVLPAAQVDPSVSQATSRNAVGANVGGGSDVTLSATQAGYGVVTLIGALTANINVIFPNSGKWTVNNQTTGAFTVTCKTAGGTGYAVRQGFTYNFYTDGTNMLPDGPQTFWGTAAAPTLQVGEVYYQYS